MSETEKIDAYIFSIYTNDKDAFEEQVLVIEDVIIHRGHWATGAQDRIAGILEGLELANYPSNVTEIKIIDAELKESFDAEKLMKYARTGS